ncbi:bifunctional diaminohydroxyphosphoribosylaminopyrimidine deaminase/5-amino-6-(5-phosphoribosylamino)uracil reductase RibD [Gimibacter soli]|uniref:Riboflavin biosynthesis protein RibD n=1 Tax=Gimibacter soli TaxID=3024400 RepID=A0AAF0BL38_9PROT|nr:bifunctional diaminohydroxyphosphoribosylaminopyrimidine deaminase/5-amino-6-(5-phosphoribosylamino)uracil reductase RibD [Gimibacter soli]WCL52995.1 bifunctional diaminohydroxyphosphoribosylaminopyrimidine deaminase/5-amino-6-(5-phosphoribosylamino)uracil reductase RibD [Gimibacter soli]
MAGAPQQPDDARLMGHALTLARRGMGRTFPNPSVGCVLVKDGVVIGRGYTQPGGRPHAEAEALRRAGGSARGATAYVTLEPCAHHGKTPPCAEALVAAGVARVVTAAGDPDPRVAGRGITILKAAGIKVTEGVRKGEAEAINAGFFSRVTTGQPAFTLKMATSLDGRIALSNGESRWITGPESRHLGHMMRATHDAILVGIGTALADDPVLDCRIEGLEDRSPIRIVLDRTLRLPVTSKLVQSAARLPLWVITECAEGPAFDALAVAGVKLLNVSDIRDLNTVAMLLGDEDLTRVLVEGGGRVHASFLKAGLAARVEHFVSGMALGGDATPAIAALGLTALGSAPRLKLHGMRPLGPDVLASWIKEE